MLDGSGSKSTGRSAYVRKSTDKKPAFHDKKVQTVFPDKDAVFLPCLLGVTIMSTITFTINILILMLVAWLVCHLPGITWRRIPSVRILPDVS